MLTRCFSARQGQRQFCKSLPRAIHLAHTNLGGRSGRNVVTALPPVSWQTQAMPFFRSKHRLLPSLSSGG